MLFTCAILNGQSKGDLIVGANSNFSGSISGLNVSPSFAYQVDDTWQVGLTSSVVQYNVYKFDYTNVFVRYYDSRCSYKHRPFLQLHVGTSINDKLFSSGIAVGLTAKLTKWLVFEPKLQLTYSESVLEYGFQGGANVGFGILL
jgi:long-subunit fatty acid transport protein